MYKLRSLARRSTVLGSAVALLLATFAPSASVFADALNPLTHRSLTLASSSPGWDFTDGSGNATYAMPNSGANGQKTGNTFSFNVSTDNSATTDKVKAFTFQYCTTSAGNCQSPGNNGWTGTAPAKTRNADSVANKTSDLNIVTGSGGHAPAEMSSSDFASMITSGGPSAIPNRDDSQGTFVVMTNTGDPASDPWSYSPDWAMTAENNETNGTIGDGKATGKNNFIKLTNTGAGMGLPAGAAVKIIFFGTDNNYITNPGAGAFFVKINDYSSTTTFNDTTIIDGGVTVANVMNQSIQITTKVLETMDFSVGTVDPYTLNSAQLTTATGKPNAKHGLCDPILPSMGGVNDKPNTLNLGDEVGEYSLSTRATYSTHSYWRLSSNSSAGATVYYAGVTLKNTVGDQINPIGTTAQAPSRGTPQFGLALANGTLSANYDIGLTNPYKGNFNVVYPVERGGSNNLNYESGADNGAATMGVDPSVATDHAATNVGGFHTPSLAPLRPMGAYDAGAGVINPGTGSDGLTDGYGPSADTKFAFDPQANQIPAALARESSQVVDCVTAKVRYIANIAATTPAGIYTTKINYIAAPQY